MGTVSGKSVGEKLFLKPGRSVRFISPPAGWTKLLGDHSATVLSARSKQLADVIILFALNRAQLEISLAAAKAGLAPGGALWIGYRKGGSGMKSDIHRNSIAAYAKTVGLEVVSIISIDEVWSCVRCKVIG